jgi:hypothetical protein
MPRDLVDRVLASAQDDVVLIGGQALAFWMDHFDVQGIGNLPAVSRDVDFFTRDAANSAPLRRFAEAIRGRAHVAETREITALIGSAIAPAADDLIYNVDLLHSVIGLERDQVLANSIEVHAHGTGTRFRVMHPLDVLQSRNANLHRLQEKQNEIGELQLRLAIGVARKYLEGRIAQLLNDPTLAEHARQRAILDAVRVVDDYSDEDAAKKNASRYGIHLADAIPAWLVTSPNFWRRQWAHLRQRMSPAYAETCEARRNAIEERD